MSGPKQSYYRWCAVILGLWCIATQPCSAQAPQPRKIAAQLGAPPETVLPPAPPAALGELTPLPSLDADDLVAKSLPVAPMPRVVESVRLGAAVVVSAAPEARPTVLPEPSAPPQVKKEPTQPKPKVEDSVDFFAKLIQLTPPNAERLFQMESEETLRNRWRSEARKQAWPLAVEFPDAKEETRTPDHPRLTPHMPLIIEPHYLCTKRLWFEQPHAERYRRHIGVLQPILSAGVFYSDVTTLPLEWLAQPFRCFECHREAGWQNCLVDEESR